MYLQKAELKSQEKKFKNDVMKFIEQLKEDKPDLKNLGIRDFEF